MAETLCQKRALEAFRLDPAKWGGMRTIDILLLLFFFEVLLCRVGDCTFGFYA